jgi:hypothetical protein
MGRSRSWFKRSKKSKKKLNNEKRTSSKVVDTAFASAEVIDVIMEDTHPAYNPTQFITVGCVKARKIGLEFSVKEEDLQWYHPIFGTGLFIPPLIGEVILLTKATGRRGQTDRKSEELYYLPPVNIWQDVNNNQLPGSSYRVPSGEPSEAEKCNPSGVYSANPGTLRQELPDVPLGKIFTAKDIQRLYPYEGDMIAEGRSGHSIRYGSVVKNAEYPNWWSNCGEHGDPIVIISDGHYKTPGEFTIGDNTYENIYKMEDINKDGAVVVLTDTQCIPVDITAKDGDNLRQDSYGNSPTVKKQKDSSLDYQETKKEEAKDNEETEPIEDKNQEQEAKKQNEQKEEIEKEQEIKEEEKEESNTEEDEITDFIFGGYLAHLVAGGKDYGWKYDSPKGIFGQYKWGATPDEIAEACEKYTGDLEGATVILDSGIGQYLGKQMVHLFQLTLPSWNISDCSYELITQLYDGTFERHAVTKKAFFSWEERFYKGRSLTIDKAKNKRWPTNDIPGDKKSSIYSPNTQGEFVPINQLEQSEWNITETYQGMVKRLETAMLRKHHQYYEIDGEPGIRGNPDNGNWILVAMKALKKRGVAEIKLLGVGDFWANHPNVPDPNVYLQEMADQVDICTFIGGFEQKKSGTIFGGEPIDIEAYRVQINGTGRPPAPAKPPLAVGYKLVDTHRGMNIMVKTSENGYQTVTYDTDQLKAPPWSTEIVTVQEMPSIAPLDEIDKGYWLELQIDTVDIGNPSKQQWIRSENSAIEEYKSNIDMAFEDWE